MSTPGNHKDPRQEREEALLRQALQQPPDQRSSFLDRMCQGDAALRRRLDALLAGGEESARLRRSDTSAPGATLEVGLAEAVADDPRGRIVGRYKLLEEIGEGAFGQVYMAEQKEPVHRKVALKIIKAGMDTKEVVARFEAERQALALMDHPNIAQVFDGGVTQAGRPYFVMELVKGIPITDYCDRQSLPMAERLQLFMQVCHAVQHAHQKGIIHRDLKPGNILVTLIDGKPVPKIIDFGVAKALGRQLTEKTLFTAFEQIIGTPAYMSPEQTAISGVDVDTRSDIYSLGVLLYELLTGVTPIDAEMVRKAGLDEVRRMIRETDPPMPSTRLRTLGDKLTDVAHHRHAEPSTLTRMVHGDLDWIVMKALEKERNRRYATANALDADLRRYLEHRPVEARPPSTVYRFRKLVRRNRPAFALGAAVLVALLFGIAASSWQIVRATRAYRDADATAVQEAQLRDQAESRERATRARALFASKQYDQADTLVRDLPAGLVEEEFVTLTPVLRGLGHWHAGGKRWQQSRAYYEMLLFGAARQSEALYQGVVAPEAEAALKLNPIPYEYLFPEYARLLLELGDGNAYEELRETAITKYGDTLKASTASLMLGTCLLTPPPERHRVTLCRWATIVELYQSSTDFHYNTYLALFEHRRGNEDGALQLAQSCLDADPGVARAATAHALMALAYSQLNRADDARAELASGHELIDARFSEDVGVGNYWTNLWAYWVTGRILLREAETLVGSSNAPIVTLAAARETEPGKQGGPAWDEAMRRGRRELIAATEKAAEQEGQTYLLGDLANLLRGPDTRDEAEVAARKNVALQRKFYGSEHTEVARALCDWAYTLDEQDKDAEAERVHREALAMRRKLFGNEHEDVVQSIMNVGWLCEQQNKLAEAGELYREASAITRKLFGDEPDELDNALRELVRLLQDQGNFEEAVDLWRQEVALRKETLGEDHSSVARALTDLGNALGNQGKPAEAEEAFRQALAIRRKLLGNEHPDVALTLNHVGDCLRMQNKWDEAEAVVREGLEMRRKLLGNEHVAVAVSLMNLAFVLDGQSRFAEAEAVTLEVLAMRRKLFGDEHSEVAFTLGGLAHVLEEQDKLTEAETAHRKELAIRRKVSPDAHRSLAVSLGNLTRVLNKQGKFLEAEPIQLEALALRRKALGNEHLVVSDSLADLAILKWAQGQSDEAETLHHEALAMRKTLLIEQAKSGKPSDLNAIGWLLATCDDASLRDGMQAIAYAERAVEMTGREKPGMLNTLAAAYAEAGRFTNAADVQREAIALLEGDQDKPGYQVQLRFYESNRPYREGDSWKLRSIGDGLRSQRKWAEAEALFRNTLTLQRRTLGSEAVPVALSLNRLALVLEAQGRLAEAEVTDREALLIERRLRPDDPANLSISANNLALALRAQGKLAEARTCLLEALEFSRERSDEDPPSLITSLANLEGRLGNWTNASALYQTLIETEPEGHMVWYRAHATALVVGQVDFARELCQGMLSRFSDTEDPAICERVARSVFLSPAGSNDLGRAVELVEKAFKTNSTSPWVRSAKGMAEYRLANYATAAELLEQPSNDRDPSVGCLAGYFLAMSLHQQGDTEAAQTVLKQANTRFAKVLRAGDLGEAWHDSSRNLVARSEAERLILGREISPPVTAASLAEADHVRQPVVRLLRDGYSLAEEGKWKESAEAYAAALEHPGLDWALDRETSVYKCLGLQMGTAFVKAGDRDSHERLCRFIMDVELAGSGDPNMIHADRFARVCFLNGRSLPEDLQKRGLEMMRFAVANLENGGIPYWTPQTGGIVEYYVGDPKRAVELLLQAEKSPQIVCRGPAMVYRAMALKKLGRDAEAAEVLQEAEALMAESLKTGTAGVWWDLEFCQMALDEAHQSIQLASGP